MNRFRTSIPVHACDHFIFKEKKKGYVRLTLLVVLILPASFISL